MALTQQAQDADTREGFSSVSDEPLVKAAVCFANFKIRSFLHFFLVFFVTGVDVRQS